MEPTKVFETYQVSCAKDNWREAVNEIRSLVQKSEIKIIDIKREKDRLRIVYRKLQ